MKLIFIFLVLVFVGCAKDKPVKKTVVPVVDYIHIEKPKKDTLSN